MEYSKEDLMEAKKQIWGVGENMGTEESKKIWEENAGSVIGGSVIGCKQFSCSGDAVWRLIMGCRRMLGAWDRAAIMAGG